MMCWNSSLAFAPSSSSSIFLPLPFVTRPLHSTDLEQAVLGALLIDADSIVDVMAIITPADFYDPVHRDVFRTMTDLYEQARGFDLLSLADRM